MFSTFGVQAMHASATNADGSPDLLAGSHPFQMKTSFMFWPYHPGQEGPKSTGFPKSVDMRMPAGLTGDPSSVPQCPAHDLPAFEEQVFGLSQCPADSQVGILSLDIFEGTTFTFPLYNVTPEAGVPVELGVYALVMPVTFDARMTPEHGYALEINVEQMSQMLPIVGMSVTLWGVPADHAHDPYRGECLEVFEEESKGKCPSNAPQRPFLTLPTQCSTTPSFSAVASSWAQPDVSSSATASLQEGGSLEGCDGLDFSPALEVKSESHAADAPTGLEVGLEQPFLDAAGGRGEAVLEHATIDLPAGMSINVAAADGLQGCSAAQVALASTAAVSCPDSSKVGSAEIETPLLPAPLLGSLYLGQPPDPFQGRLTAYLIAQGDGVMVKLPMQIVADPSDGRLTVLVEGIPEIGFSKMKLTFRGGPRAPLANPAGCGSAPVVAQLGSYSQPLATLDRLQSISIDEDCGEGFSPSFVAGDTSATAGESSAFVMSVARADGEQPIESFSTQLPEGLLARLGSVQMCEGAAAEDGGCAAATQVGTITVGAGAGSHPFYLSGRLYLTGPYEGAPYGLSIVVPALAGPFDLGTVVVRARLLIDRHDAQLTLNSDRLPSILHGVPLRIRSLTVRVDRPGFIVNPTSCGSQQVLAQIVGARTTASVGAPFALSGCAHLSFAPRVSASATAKVSRARGVGVDLHIAQTGKQRANMQTLRLVFPSQLSARLGAVRRSCTQTVFVADPARCPSGSRIGYVRAETALLSAPFEGPVYLVSDGTRTRPRIDALLQAGSTALELSGFLKVVGGRLSLTMNGLPDASISSLEVTLPAGAESILGVNTLSGVHGSLCGQRLVFDTAVSGQNGSVVHSAPHVAVQGCRKGA
jgi:hypothetical protein